MFLVATYFFINNASLDVHLSIYLSRNSFSDLSEIKYVGRGQRVIHDGVPSDSIQDHGHKTLKVRNFHIFKVCVLCHLQWELLLTADS